MGLGLLGQQRPALVAVLAVVTVWELVLLLMSSDSKAISSSSSIQ
jgi:hypothetical protein